MKRKMQLVRLRVRLWWIRKHLRKQPWYGPARELSQQQREREGEALVREFPAMGERETAAVVVGIAEQLAVMHNLPALARDPNVWRLIYMAGLAVDAVESGGDVA
jgi:hypothetical protein